MSSHESQREAAPRRAVAVRGLRVGLVLLLAAWGLLAVLGERGASGRDEGAALYVGNDVCANCHQAEHDLWTGSSHFHTFERVTKDNLPADVLAEREVDHPPGKTRFRKVDGRYLAETVSPDGTVFPYELTHVVGRMRVRMFVATLPDGRMQVLPAMIEEPTQEWFDYSHLIFGAGGTDWDTPPIIAHDDPSSWTGPVRSWDARCAYCHVSGYQPRRPDAEGKGRRYSARMEGIDCEMCHGPGAAHVEFREQKMQGDDPILRFADLAHDRALGVCLQCHMEAETIDPDFPLGADVFEYRDPTLLTDPERVDPSGRPLELIYDGLAMSTSRCVKEGKLTCISCHDPHGSSNPSQLKDDPQNDKLCTRCHEDIAALGKAHTHHDPKGSGSRCVNCHMPFLQVERKHGVIADHSISIPRFDLVGDRLAQTACAWCHEGNVNAPEGVPKVTEADMKAAHARWWPEGAEARPWMQALGRARLGEEDAHKGLLAVVKNEGNARVVRASAAELLGRYAGKVPLALMVLTRDSDSLVRRRAVSSLSELRGESVDRALQQALRDPSRAVRFAAARGALAGWKRVRENPTLLRAILPVLAEDAEARPEDDMRWFRLAAAYSIADEKRKALAAYERVVELDPFAEHARKEVERLREALK